MQNKKITHVIFIKIYQKVRLIGMLKLQHNNNIAPQYKINYNIFKIKQNKDENIQSSKALQHYRQTDGQNIYRIDAHLRGESAQKEIGAISQLGAEKITFPPKRG